MTPQSRLLLRADVMPAEGTGPIKNGRLMPYFDCCGKFFRKCTCEKQGKLTIGHGRNIEDRGLTALESEVLLDHDLAEAETDAKQAFPWFGDLNDVRQRVLTEMVFNLGLTKLLEFKNTLAAMANKQHDRAAAGMLSSRWATQVKGRAVRLARMWRDGA